MDERLLDIMRHKEGNHLLPFLWMRQGKRQELPELVQQIYDSGARALCVESRTHQAFCDREWWEDMDVVLAEARKRDMKVWILDDRYFPTGCANGLIAEKYPQLRKWHLAEDHVDVVGPAGQNAMLLRSGEEEILLGVYAYRRSRDSQVLEGPPIDLTGHVKGRYVYWDVPRGVWRVMAFYKTRRGAVQKDYIHFIDKASVDVLIEGVYEPHYARYGHLFGSTVAGFFSDEPNMGNCQTLYGAGEASMYDQRLGQPGLALPWTEELFEKLKASLGTDALGLLAALWYEIGEQTPAVRVTYMDILTGLWRENFTERIGAWCRQRGVAYTGHIIEDMNASTRLGWSAGHFFRAMDGQDMAGIDVVLHQVMPGLAHYPHATALPGGYIDPEFFHYMPARLAVSHSHIQPRMQNRAMCEIFGAYGWAEGVPMMRRLVDHMLVRGINHFVPHAFSPDYPDPDCPPHFHAGGCNPQFDAFSQLMRYTNRVCHLLEGAQETVSGAILYHAEGEWSGREYMLAQKPAKQLYDAQLNYDILPMDALLEQAWVENGTLRIGRMRYPVLLIPYAAWLPERCLEKLRQLEAEGGKLAFVGGLPEGCGWGRVIALEETAAFTEKLGGRDVAAEPRFPLLRVFHGKRDGCDLFMVVNESMEEAFDGALLLPVKGMGSKQKLLRDGAFRVDAGDGRLPLTLDRGDSVILVFGDDSWKTLPPEPVYKVGPVLEGPWTFSRKEAGKDTAWTPPVKLAKLYNITGPEGDDTFCGHMGYETVFAVDEEPSAVDLGRVGQCVKAWLNGVYLGQRIDAPYVFDISGAVQKGENTLKVEVTNSLVHRQPDDLSRFVQIPPSGLMGPVRLLFAQ